VTPAIQVVQVRTSQSGPHPAAPEGATSGGITGTTVRNIHSGRLPRLRKVLDQLQTLMSSLASIRPWPSFQVTRSCLLRLRSMPTAFTDGLSRDIGRKRVRAILVPLVEGNSSRQNWRMFRSVSPGLDHNVVLRKIQDALKIAQGHVQHVPNAREASEFRNRFSATGEASSIWPIPLAANLLQA